MVSSKGSPEFGLGLMAVLMAALTIGCGGDDSSSGGSGTGSAPATIPQPTEAQLRAAGLARLPLAPESERVDIEAPTFSSPTEITNPLFPVSDLHSVVFSGRVEGEPFHTETTLLPETKVIEWAPGQQVEALVSQYTAFVGGRLEEVATDYYAQADDGSVWYMGEDVFEYNQQGFSDSNLGSWFAGREGPPEMIMPADPQVGDVHRAENIPAIAFEEVAIKRVDKTVLGPSGRVQGAIVARELHDDGTYSDKVFAPGYGEFYTAHGGEVEALALAMPTDAVDRQVPGELKELSAAADDAFDATRTGNWRAAASHEEAALRAWDALQERPVPPRLTSDLDRALRALGFGVGSRDRVRAGTGAIDVAQSALDLELRYGSTTEIDLARFELWARQILVDAAANDVGGVRSDISTMEWVRDRFAHTLNNPDLTAIDSRLVSMREALLDGDLALTTKEAGRLRHTLAGADAGTN
jgi:hypothetical protein